MENEMLMKWINAGQTSIPTLLLQHYRELNLTNDELVLIIQLKSYIDRGDSFPNIEMIAQNMGLTKNSAFKGVHQLIQKRVLSIETKKDENGITQDAYSLSFLWEKLLALLNEKNQVKTQQEQAEKEVNLYSVFEAEFGRPLSPFEMETLTMWVEEDGYSDELIQLALREAVLSQVYNFKYIDRILLSWEKKNIRTKDQVEKETRRYREYTASKNQTDFSSSKEPSSSKTSPGPVPMVNWLEDKGEEKSD